MKQYPSRFPKFGDWLLRLLARYDDNPHMRGDFDEEFSLIYETEGFVRAWFWYWMHLLRSLPVLIRDILFWRFVMLRNYLKIAFRVIKKQKLYSLLNIMGLAISLTCAFLILFHVKDEMSFEKNFPKAERIYRIQTNSQYGSNFRSWAPSAPGSGIWADRSSAILLSTEIVSVLRKAMASWPITPLFRSSI
jgi:hypothetical protein